MYDCPVVWHCCVVGSLGRAGWAAASSCLPSARVEIRLCRLPCPPDVITIAVRWYLRYGLSYRDVEELLAERNKRGSYPTEVNTDRAPAYVRVLDEVLPGACHIVEQ